MSNHEAQTVATPVQSVVLNSFIINTVNTFLQVSLGDAVEPGVPPFELFVSFISVAGGLPSGCYVQGTVHPSPEVYISRVFLLCLALLLGPFVL